MGDWLLFANNLVLGLFFLPTLFEPQARVHPITAAVYTVMIAIGAIGYTLNGQWLPAVPTAFGVLCWAIMLAKSIRKP